MSRPSEAGKVPLDYTFPHTYPLGIPRCRKILTAMEMSAFFDFSLNTVTRVELASGGSLLIVIWAERLDYPQG